MIPSTFEYFAPTTVAEAVSLLQEHGDDAQLLAGGHSLIPAMKLRLAEPGCLVDINKIAELTGISVENNVLVIGAMTTHYQLESSPLVAENVPILTQTAGEIGDVQVRNRGTLGGSLAHADPAADWPATILALDATIKTVGPNAERSIAATDFFQGLYETALEPEEIVTQIHIPIPDADTHGTYLKMRQVASGFALTGVAAMLKSSSDNRCEQIAIGITGVADVAYRATAVETAITGGLLTADNIAAAAEKAVEDVEFMADLHADEAYRANLAKIYTRRAIETLAGV